MEAVLAGDKPTRRGAISAPLYDTPRAVSTGPNWAYLRIAEGCDNRCAYCVIPVLRGKFRSRTKESILEEARLLAASGVKELHHRCAGYHALRHRPLRQGLPDGAAERIM